ncbi:hypothetical protein MQE36_06620 [Zhouia spongiae]|uniref:SMI1/KNR4 family protein n=1 Tax=Zhouia spongiae TaxID=2202721 RepID=A0ABY3YQU6_9FLAO|nr:hypothetical protein [Zhouia spongiae]UNZ00016.1 hypothetical protein MQE36_06620 [Zhouia spongiae]
MIQLELSENSFLINGRDFSFPFSITELQEALGKYDKKTTTKYSIIYTWHNLGIQAYVKEGQTIEGLSLDLVKENYKFSPEHTFNGSFLFNDEEIIGYYKKNKNQRVKLFKGDTSGALVQNGIAVWFSCGIDDKTLIEGLSVKPYKYLEEEKVAGDKYLIKELDEEIIEFEDFGFKISVIQELMYCQDKLQPKFDLYEFVDWYDKRDIDIEEEGYDPIPEVTQYFRDLPIPKRLASDITEINQDGGNDIYLNLVRFAEGWEDYWDIETAKDAEKFPNLKKVTLCYASDNVFEEFEALGIKAEEL